MFKKIFYLILVLCSLTKTYYAEEKRVDGCVYRRIEKTNLDEYSVQNTSDNNDIGHSSISMNTYRTLYGFDISDLPPNSTINSVTIYTHVMTVWRDDSTVKNFQYKITDATLISSDSDQYIGIGNATTVLTVNYLDKEKYATVTNEVISAINNGQSVVYFGACAIQEPLSPAAGVEMHIVINYTKNVSYTAQNNFSEGLIYVQTPTVPGGNQNAPYPFTVVEDGSVTLGAVEDNQTDENGYTRIFNDTEAPSNKSNWLKWKGASSYNSGSSSTINFNANYSDNNVVYEAQMKKICNVTFSANISGYLTVSSTNHSYPYTTTVVELNSTASVNAPNQSLDGSVRGEFVKWSDNVTTATRSVTPTGTTEVTAYYKIYPNNSYRNMQFNSTIGDPITITWSEHPNSNVGSYKIYRKLYGQTTGTLISTVSRGESIHTYIDYDYLVTENTGENSRIFYDVRAVYSGTLPDNTSYTTNAEEDYQMQFGAHDIYSNQSDDTAIAKASENIAVSPVEYSLGSYPNPFNPTTVIRYTVPEAGQVSLKVYNILSQEVANLVESNQSAGVHQVNFNASHLPTGIYIARLQAGVKVMTAKLQLVK
jgi:hypothetical protein